MVLPMQQPQEERRPRVNVSGSPNLVVDRPIDTLQMSYEDYEQLVPPAEDLVPYGPDHPTQKEPIIYWNPFFPDAYIKPWPQLAAFHAQNGKCFCTNDAERKAWERYLGQYTNHVEMLRVTPAGTGDFTFECGTCHFETTNPVAWTDHIRWQKHK
jgi:hypothetical protein